MMLAATVPGILDSSDMLLLKCCFTSTETVGLLGTGAQDGCLDFHTAPELRFQDWSQRQVKPTRTMFILRTSLRRRMHEQ